jgi:pyruvate formate lyase activating enzyme
LHKELTGKGNRLILDNLAKAADYVRSLRNSAAGSTERTHNAGGGRGIKLWIRTPLIPGHTATEENIGGIAGFIIDYVSDAAERWELCTFNAACVTKYNKMQLPWPYKDAAIMTQTEIDRIKGYALNRGFPADKLIVTGLSKPG